MAKLREKKRYDDTRARVRVKVRKIVAGQGATPFTARELSVINGAELETFATTAPAVSPR